MNLIEITQKFSSELSCIEYMESIRWGKYVRCPYCNRRKIGKRNKDHRWHCKSCEKSFSVTTGTNLHNTRLPLRTWVMAIAIITDAKKGVSAMQLQRNIGVHYETAWKMYMKLRALMVEDVPMIDGIAEMDETFIGGKPRWGADFTTINPRKRIELDTRLKELKKNGIILQKSIPKKKTPDINVKRGRGTNKIPVVGIVQRDGNVIAQVMKDLTYKNLKDMVRKFTDEDNTVLITDEYKGYNKISQIIEHVKIEHNRRLYSYKGVNTNSIESFWAIIKRGIIGQYHKVSPKYLPDYIAEFVFKYNNRKEDDMFDTLIMKCLEPVNR